MTITDTTVRREDVWGAFRHTSDVRLRERSQCILLFMDGHRCPDIAQWLSRDKDTIRRWVAALHAVGRAGLKRAPIPGRPA